MHLLELLRLLPRPHCSADRVRSADRLSPANLFIGIDVDPESRPFAVPNDPAELAAFGDPKSDALGAADFTAIGAANTRSDDLASSNTRSNRAANLTTHAVPDGRSNRTAISAANDIAEPTAFDGSKPVALVAADFTAFADPERKPHASTECSTVPVSDNSPDVVADRTAEPAAVCSPKSSPHRASDSVAHERPYSITVINTNSTSNHSTIANPDGAPQPVANTAPKPIAVVAPKPKPIINPNRSSHIITDINTNSTSNHSTIASPDGDPQPVANAAPKPIAVFAPKPKPIINPNRSSHATPDSCADAHTDARSLVCANPVAIP